MWDKQKDDYEDVEHSSLGILRKYLYFWEYVCFPAVFGLNSKQNLEVSPKSMKKKQEEGKLCEFALGSKN